MQINDAYDYLIHLIYCAINGQNPSPLPQGITYEDVLQCGIRHDLAGFAYIAVSRAKPEPDRETLDKWEQHYLIAVNRHYIQEKAREDLISALHSKQIATLELQGTKVKQYYPSPELRTMSDIDIIIKKEDASAAENALNELGYITKRNDCTEIVGKADGINIELHTDFFPDDSHFHKIMSDPFRYAEAGDDFNAYVTDTVFWTYHLLHCLKHYRGKGIGLRRVLDLYFLKPEMEKTADIGYVNGVLEENGFADDLHELYDIAGYWFGGKDSDKSTEKAAETIKSAGTHGNSRLSLNNKLSIMKKEGKRHVKLQQLMSVLFPSKERMYHSYPYCKEHNYPYFICFFYRAIRLLFKKGSLESILRYIKNLILS